MTKFRSATLLLLTVLLAGQTAFGQKEESPSTSPAPPASLPDVTPDAKGNLSQEQMQELFRVVADKDIENDKRLRNYTYVERDEEHKLDRKGQVRSTEIKTYEVMELYGEQVQRLIEKNNKTHDNEYAAREAAEIKEVGPERRPRPG